MSDYYLESFPWENLMRRAFPNKASNKPGMHMSNLRNLFWAEEGNSCVKHLPPFEKQLVKVKDHLTKALDQLTKKTRSENKKYALQYLKEQVEFSTSASDIARIVTQALEATKPAKS